MLRSGYACPTGWGKNHRFYFRYVDTKSVDHSEGEGKNHEIL